MPIYFLRKKNNKEESKMKNKIKGQKKINYK